MARLFPTGIDLAKAQLLNPRIHNNGGAPSSPVLGQLYFDTSTTPNRLFYWDGAAWVNRATDSDLHEGATLASVRSFNLTTGQRPATAISDFDTQVNTHKVHDLALATAALNMNSQKITNLANGTAANDAINLAQLQSVQSGLDTKQSVRAASTANVTVTYNATGGTSARGQITAAPNQLDGVNPLVAGDRLLLKDQSTGAQNGIWVVTTAGTGANGVWDRAGDFDSDAEVTSGAFTFVTEGTVNGNSGWQLTTDDPIIIGGASGTALVWAQFSGAGQIIAGAALSKTGNQLDVNAGLGISLSTPTGDAVNIDTTITARWKTFLLTGAAASYALTHNLANQRVLVNVFRNSGTFETIDPDIQRTDANTVTIDFAGVAQVSNTWAATVVG